MPRVNIGGKYLNENGEVRQRAWIDVSAALMSKAAAVATEESTTPDEILAEYVTGEREFPDDVTEEEIEEAQAEQATADD